MINFLVTEQRRIVCILISKWYYLQIQWSLFFGIDSIHIYPAINIEARETKPCKMDISDSRTGIEISSVILWLDVHLSLHWWQMTLLVIGKETYLVYQKITLHS